MKLRTLMLVVTGICLMLGSCIGMYRQVVGPVIPNAKIDQIVEGMSQAEVKRIVGPPTHYDPDSSWRYERIFNPGYVQIYFSADGVVDYVNDDSVVPRHQR